MNQIYVKLKASSALGDKANWTLRLGQNEIFVCTTEPRNLHRYTQEDTQCHQCSTGVQSQLRQEKHKFQIMTENYAPFYKHDECMPGMFESGSGEERGVSPASLKL